MAHNFKDKGSNTSFVSRKEIAWHKLGKVVDSMTSKECMTLAGLDFEVGLAPLVALVNNPILVEESKKTNIVTKINSTLYRSKEVEGSFATYRTDTNEVFGVVGSRYEVIQNIEAFEFFDSIIGEGHAYYETAGALGNGETIFLTAKLPSKLIVGKEDIDKYLLFTMAHDGSSSVQVMFTPIRVVCNNTLSAAIQSTQNKVTIRHTKNARKRLEVAKEILGLTSVQSGKYEEVFNLFTKTKITDKVFKDFIDVVFNFESKDEQLSTRSENKRNSILEYYEVGVGQEGIQGTLWGAYNTVTGYLQNGIDRDDASAFKNTFLKSDVAIRNSAMSKALSLI